MQRVRSDSKWSTTPTLAERFIVPPFSVLDARADYWRKRKRVWTAMGIQGELGRGENLQDYNLSDQGTSVFDPVLCEILYRWFSAPGDRILDPFAGGSVRGMIAAYLNRLYTGIDLRSEQVLCNREQADKISFDLAPRWLLGDSDSKLTFLREEYDFILTCPPYWNLEKYSDDSADLSNAQSYEEFLIAYCSIVRQTVSLLRPNRFACFVVANIRGDLSKVSACDRNGDAYYPLVSDTITAFEDAGAHFYNDAILLTPVGGVAMAASSGFEVSRKLGKVHQNVLVFCKGDPVEATRHCATIEDTLQDATLNLSA